MKREPGFAKVSRPGRESINLLNPPPVRRIHATDRAMAEAFAKRFRQEGFNAEAKNLGPKGYARSRWVVDVETTRRGE